MEHDSLSRLNVIEEIASELSAEAVAMEARSLAQRAAEGRFFVACVGQFKRGKSTLINALVGDSLLPTGTVPVTSVVTVLRHGPARAARVRSDGSEWQEISPEDLPLYVTEEHNPGNAHGINAVEIYSPSPILAGGLCFVDTPGLGSVFDANTEATRTFVPNIDAALVLFGADPPITGEEVDLVADVARHVGTFLFILNKADRVSSQECGEAARFAIEVLSRRLGQPIGRVYVVSATEMMSHGTPTRDWADLERDLRSLADADGMELVQSAVERGVGHMVTRLRNVLREEEAALLAPIEETERRVRALTQASEDAARGLWQIGPMLDAEMRMLAGEFAGRRQAFIAEVSEKATSMLTEAIREETARFGPTLRALAMERAQEIAQRFVLPWLRSSERTAADSYRHSVERCAKTVNDLLETLRASDSWSGIPLPGEVADETGLSERGRFLFDKFERVESPAGLVPALAWLADAILPRGHTLRRVERAAQTYLSHMLHTNARRVENSIKQRIQGSRMRMESQIRYSLKEVLEAAERGLRRAKDAEERGKDAVHAELQRLKQMHERLEAVE